MEQLLLIIGDLEVTRRELLREIKARDDHIAEIEQRIRELEDEVKDG